MAEKSKPATLAIIGKVRFGYAHVFEPSAIEGNEPKYSVSLIIPKKDKALLEKIEKAIEAAKAAGIKKFGDKWAKKLKMPLRDGDEERDEDENYKNCMFMNASSKTRPGVVDSSRETIIDHEEFYSGCYGYASVNFYPFSSNGNNGIAAGLNNLMKTADGEKLAGRTSATEDFADIDEDLM